MTKNISFSDGKLSVNEQNIVIPKINLVEIIGSGANGVVFKAHDTFLNRDVAVKIWLPHRGHQYPDKER